MSRFWTRSLAAQIIWFMLPLMLLAQSVGFLLTADQRATELREIALDEFLVRSATAVQMVQTTPPEHWDAVLDAMGTNYSRFWLSDEAPADMEAWSSDAWRRLHQPLKKGLGDKAPTGPWGTESDAEMRWGTTGSDTLESTQRNEHAAWAPVQPDAWPELASARVATLDDNYGTGLVARMPDGRWLNAAYSKPPKRFIWTSPTMVSMVITTIMLSILAIVVARRIARPMRSLTAAADALGRGEQTPHIPEEGPEDIRRTAIAFNQMQERLNRFMADRNATLAAIGHDLRTPITTMRLRTEFVADDETRARLLDTINELQAITDAALEFTQEQSVDEPTRNVDVSALAESICNDLSDLGRDVTFVGNGALPYRCRPAALRRAIRNLVENAVVYGQRARVAVLRTAHGIVITVEDDGPGIPAKDMEQVFQPFVRLDESIGVRPGGLGLGLSIARTAARSHGGDVVLSNLPNGLRATIDLPAIPASS